MGKRQIGELAPSELVVTILISELASIPMQDGAIPLYSGLVPILTVLGVFIGCTSIIVMVSIGAGMKESQDQMIANMGDVTVIEVYANGDSKLNDDAVENFRAIAGVTAVMPKASLGNYAVQLFAGANAATRKYRRYSDKYCSYTRFALYYFNL